MTTSDDLCRRYDGPVPPDKLAEAEHGPYAAELIRVNGRLAEQQVIVRNQLRIMAKMARGDPRFREYADWLKIARENHALLREQRDALIALRRAAQKKAMTNV